MKIAIRTDMEGMAGITHRQQFVPGEPLYEAGRSILTAELNALIRGIRKGGGTAIHIYDEHFQGTNIDLSALSGDDLEIVCGKPPYTKEWPGGLTRDMTGLILQGLHAKAGTPEATLAHTYEPDIQDIYINGTAVGEIGVEAAVAGDLDIPLILVLADSAGVQEAEALIPGVHTVTTKRSRSWSGATCYPLERVLHWIEATSEEAIRAHAPQPLKFSAPVTLEITLQENSYREAFSLLYPDLIVGNRVTLQKETTTEAWALYWQCKLGAQQRARAAQS